MEHICDRRTNSDWGTWCSRECIGGVNQAKYRKEKIPKVQFAALLGLATWALQVGVPENFKKGVGPPRFCICIFVESLDSPLGEEEGTIWKKKRNS